MSDEAQQKPPTITIVMDQFGDVDFDTNCNILQAVYMLESLKTKLVTSSLMEAAVKKQQASQSRIVPARLQVDPNQLKR